MTKARREAKHSSIGTLGRDLNSVKSDSSGRDGGDGRRGFVGGGLRGFAGGSLAGGLHDSCLAMPRRRRGGLVDQLVDLAGPLLQGEGVVDFADRRAGLVAQRAAVDVDDLIELRVFGRRAS